MQIDSFCKLTFIIHILIAQCGFIFLTLYKTGSIREGFLRIVGMICSWLLLNVVCNGCPLTHIENNITHLVYGIWPMPNYGFEQSWANQLINQLIK